MSSADSVWSSRGNDSGRPPALPVLVLLMLLGANMRFDIEGETAGDVDIRSLSDGSSEAFLFRPDMLCWLKGESVP